MALIFYEKLTGIVRRTVMDENLTDDELAVNHLPLKDEKMIRAELTLEEFTPGVAQRLVDAAR